MTKGLVNSMWLLLVLTAVLLCLVFLRQMHDHDRIIQLEKDFKEVRELAWNGMKPKDFIPKLGKDGDWTVTHNHQTKKVTMASISIDRMGRAWLYSQNDDKPDLGWSLVPLTGMELTIPQTNIPGSCFFGSVREAPSTKTTEERTVP